MDANLPKIDDCGAICEKHPLVLCQHHFLYPTRLFYCNDIRFQGVPDLKVLTSYIDFLKRRIRTRKINFQRSLFFLVTKDLDFLQDAEKEWKKDGELEHGLEFLDDTVVCGNIVIKVLYITETDPDIRDYETLKPKKKHISKIQSNSLLPKKDKDRWYRGGFRYCIITKVNRLSRAFFDITTKV